MSRVVICVTLVGWSGNEIYSFFLHTFQCKLARNQAQSNQPYAINREGEDLSGVSSCWFQNPAGNQFNL